MRGQHVQWTSASQLDSLHARGDHFEADVPQGVIDACRGACEAYVQLGHVWRDDSILSLSEIKQKIL
jgi:hypothetical protein